MQTVRIRADIVVQDADGHDLALVEIRNRQGLTPDIAATLRRNLIVHGLVNLRSRFFLIVSQEIGYLWDQGDLAEDDAHLPTVEFPMTSVVGHYLPSLAGGARLSKSQLELAVTQWLWDLASGSEDRPLEPEPDLAPTGFLQLIRGGRIGTEIDL
ncbi:MAG TPA: hypothetical protein VFL82_11080 [Thermomicrobiales bacterium]|nr:hypothetical protein [Thermomicrobiales bacterium]